MPWNKDINGDPKYNLSAYAKEELPTWSEVYNEFYKERIYIYSNIDPDHQVIDPYWNIPHRKYLIMTVCNQFNKMIFEDGYKDALIKMINENIYEEVTDVMFICKSVIMFICKSIHYIETMDFIDGFVYHNDFNPPIYTIPLPNGKSNPFIISKDRLRISSKDIIGTTWLFPVIISKDNDNIINHIYAPNHTGVIMHEKEQEDFDAIIEFMMKPFKEYFEGDGVGWKDKDGHIIEGEPKITSCNGVGYDPAL